MKDFYTIGQLSKKFKVTNRTLRYYEEKGLLNPEKVESGYRYFSIEQAELLKKILLLKELGLSLDEINKYLHGPKEDQEKILIRHRKDNFSKLKIIEKILNNKDFSIHDLSNIIISGNNIKRKKLEHLCGIWKLNGIYSNIKDAQENRNALNKISPYKYLSFNTEGDSPWFYSANEQKIVFNTFFEPVSEIYQISDDYLYLKISNPNKHIFVKLKDDVKITSPHVLKFKKISTEFEDWKNYLFHDKYNEKLELDKNILGCWRLYGKSNDLNGNEVNYINSKNILLFEKNGTATFYDNEYISEYNWGKNYLYSKKLHVNMNFKLKGNYLVLEWKTRSYNFTEMISDYLVFERILFKQNQ